jgi:biopolymer transport protein ExbD
MSFGGRRRGLHQDGGGDGHGDLTITPLLDLLVALVPFLIFGAVMARINVVDVGISRPVASATATKKESFDLLLQVGEKSAQILLNGKSVGSVPNGANESDWANATRKLLVDIKKKYPDEFKIRIEPMGSKVTLQTLMVFMDAARRLKPEDGEILRKDDKGQNVKMQFLFPNVVLRGVYS